MSEERIDMEIPSKFAPTEQAILLYLYDHPDENIDTLRLMQILGGQQSNQAEVPYDDVEYAIESLIVGRLIRGKRTAKTGKVGFSGLRLTPKGEAVSIQERRNAEGMTFIMKDLVANPEEPEG